MNKKNKIIQLEDVCVDIKEAKRLNNSENSAFAWIFNPYKNIPEFELLAVQEMTTWEQIEMMIAEGKFYFAPLK